MGSQYIQPYLILCNLSFKVKDVSYNLLYFCVRETNFRIINFKFLEVPFVIIIMFYTYQF